MGNIIAKNKRNKKSNFNKQRKAVKINQVLKFNKDEKNLNKGSIINKIC